jgi:hypothetical protein
MSNEKDRELLDLLEGLEEEPLSGGERAAGKVEWETVRDHFTTTDPAKPLYFTVKDMMSYITEDLGVSEISYSSCHSWLRRLDKKEGFKVTKKIHEKQAYYKITPKEKVEKPEE